MAITLWRLLVMIMKPKINIVYDGANSKTYIMSTELDTYNLFDRAKAIKRFIYQETKVLEILLENNLREILAHYGIIPQDNTESALKSAFDTLKGKGITIEIIDRYKVFQNSNKDIADVGLSVMGVSPNQMTVILEDESILSCAMEIKINGNDTNN